MFNSLVRVGGVLLVCVVAACGSDDSGGGGSPGGAAGASGGSAGSSAGSGGAGASATGGSAGVGATAATGGSAGSGGSAGCTPGSPKAGEPYARSCVITKFTVNWSSHERLAAGADNWPVTWAADDHQYTAWGDGWGFDAINSGPKISLGVSRVEGGFPAYKTFDVWDGDPQGSGKPNDGKSYGILALGSDLFMWVSPGSGAKGYDEQRLWRSTNAGKAWSKASWALTKADGMVNPTFAQFGKDYAGAPDAFVYVFANEIKTTSGLSVQKPGQIALLRANKNQLMQQGAWEFFTGTGGSGAPNWSKNKSARKPVFEDAKGVGWNTSVSYNAPLKRYLLVTEHTETFKGNIGVFDAPNPWGPWTVAHYEDGFASPPGVPATAFFWNFSNKWLSGDGKSFVLVFTGIGANDSWNAVAGTFTTQ